MRIGFLFSGVFLLILGCNSAPSTNISPNQIPTGTPPPDDTPPPDNSPPPAPDNSQWTLSISMAGSGSGSVSGPEIGCGQSCSAKIKTGSTLTLTATPSADSDFLGWTGACSGAGPCTITISSDKSLTATFQLRDTQAPSVPTGLTATAASTSVINLSWSASTDNVGVAGYKVFRNGGLTPIATTSITSYSNTQLSPVTSYSYTVAAFDTAGNTSTKSGTASATTPSLPVAPSYTLGGHINGLNEGEALALRANNNAGTQTNILSLSNGETTYQMPQGLLAGSTYNLQITTSPSGKICVASNATGIVNSNITNIDINCVTQTGNCAHSSAKLWSILIRNPPEVTDYFDGIKSVACYGDNLYAGGIFKTVVPSMTGPLVKLSTDGTGGLNADSLITADINYADQVVSDGQGGFFVRTTKIVPAEGYPPWTYIQKAVHILSDNTIDSNWTPGMEFLTMTYHEGNLYAIEGINSQLVKINATTGAADPLWNLSVPRTTLTIAIRGQYVYLGGSFGVRRAKINPGGTPTLDPTWVNSLGNMIVFAIATAADGSVYAAGSSLRKIVTTADGAAQVDAAWNPDVRYGINALAIGSDGTLYAGGTISLAGGLARSNLVKITTAPSGAAIVDPWSPSVNRTVNSIIVDSSNNIYIAGDFTSVNGQTRNSAAKFSSSGVLQSWNPNADNTVSSLALSGNKILLGGKFRSMGGVYSVTNLAKFSLTTGQLDLSWNPVPNGVNYHNGIVQKLAISEDGADLYVQTHPLPSGTSTIAKISAVGSGVVDPTWRSGVSTTVDSMVAAQGSLFFSTYTGSEGRLYRVDRSGTILMNMLIGNDYAVTRTGAPTAFAISGNQLYYTTSTAPYYVKRLNLATGVVDSSWQINVNKISYLMKVHAGSLYIGFIGGTSNLDVTGSVRKYSTTATGTITHDWEISIPAAIWRTLYSLEAVGNSLYVGGRFTSINGLSRLGLAKFSTSTGTLVNDWAKNVVGPAHNYTYSMTSSADGTTLFTAEDNGLGIFSEP